MLRALNRALRAEQLDPTPQAQQGQSNTEKVLQIMETVLSEASHLPPEKYTVSVDLSQARPSLCLSILVCTCLYMSIPASVWPYTSIANIYRLRLRHEKYAASISL